MMISYRNIFHRFPGRVIFSLAVFGAFLAGETAAAEVRMQDTGRLHAGHSLQADREPSVGLEMAPSTARAGITTSLFFTVKDAEGNPIRNLTVSHERILHVIIISKDFSVFAHIHPEDFIPASSLAKTDKYELRYVFPKAGEYLIAADFAVKDVLFSRRVRVTVEGEPPMSMIREDFSRIKDFGDYRVVLDAPERVSAGHKTVLGYQVSEKGIPVTDLEPHLGAPMHLSIILTDLNRFIHAHGYRPGSESHAHPIGHIHGTVRERYGPEIDAEVVFPMKGIYKVFSEIKHKGKVRLLDFFVNVE
ncbi:MAG: hypothetical protein AB1442_15710 [Nitrospirota bacterium]